ncbi:MAG: extracellular solute-binding protein [Verrucomicrobia bacterium]|nr:extracellular solute-binding protein [Verrucomicrobiota bacterium]
MKPKFYPFYVSALVALLLLPSILSALADEILYEDNFSNLDPSWGTPGERLSANEGKLTLKPAPNTTQSILNQSNVFEDADIRVEVVVPAGDANVPGGLIFWAKDHSNFYCLCINAAGYFKISRYVTDRWLQPVGWVENEAINKGIGQVNKLRVVTKGRQATAYINDKQVTTFNGQAPQGGGCVGVSGGSPENVQNTWQFAKLQVIALPGTSASSPAPTAQPSPPTVDPQRSPSPPQQPVGRVALRLHGSNTIGKELVPALCEEFLKYEGATSVERKPRQKENETDVEAVLPSESAEPLTFEVQAHGSKTAFEDLATGKCDIGMASRQITSDEAGQCALAGLGDMFSPACEIVLGLDGIAVFVNKSNPINELTKQQIADIFSGRTTDWSQVGGNPGPINLYAGDDKSGTFDTFKSLVLNSRPLSPRALRFENSAKLSDEVAADANGIGFAGMAFVRGNKALAVSEAGAGALLPTPFTVATTHYPLSRRLFLYIPANPKNEWTQKFVGFVLSELGGPSKLTPTGFFARKFVESALTKLEVFSWWTSGSEVAALNALFDNYKKLYPGVGVINATVAGGGGSAARPILQTRLAVGNPPDTWQSHPGWELLSQYVEPNYCEPVTDLYQSAGWDKIIPKPLIEMLTKDGKTYAVLTGVHHGNVLWYNKKLLDQNGIKVGEKITFDEFFAACDKLKAAGISALGVGDSGIWASAQLFENTLLGVVGPEGWTDLFSGKMKWDDPKVKQAMQYFAKMQDYLNPDHASLTWDQAVEEVMRGKVAFTSMGDWADGEFIKAGMKEQEDFGWVNHPGTDGSFIIVADGFTLAKGAPHKDATSAWLKSIGSKEAQEAFNPLKGSIPARTDVDKSKFDSYHQWSMKEFASDKLLPSCVHGEAAPPAFQEALNEAITSFMRDKNTDKLATALVQAAGKAGPAAVGMLDFEGQTIKVENPDVPPRAPRQYVKEVSGAAKLSLYFHFRAGTSQLDDNALGELNRLVELLANPTYQRRALLLLGFSDSAGRAGKNIALSKERAKAVADQLQMRGITPSLVNGFGKEMPLASNNTAEGREKNRRVEVWLR